MKNIEIVTYHNEPKLFHNASFMFSWDDVPFLENATNYNIQVMYIHHFVFIVYDMCKNLEKFFSWLKNLWIQGLELRIHNDLKFNTSTTFFKCLIIHLMICNHIIMYFICTASESNFLLTSKKSRDPVKQVDLWKLIKPAWAKYSQRMAILWKRNYILHEIYTKGNGS